MALPDRIPFADLVDIDPTYSTPLTRLDGVVTHIAVSNAARPSYAPGEKAHGYVRKDGFLVQDVSLRMRSGACRQGNPRLWTFETQGGFDANDRETAKWTEAQLNTLARLASFANEHGVPMRLMESSQPTERGLGWHRLGIDGNFPSLPDIRAGRGQRGGGESWSFSGGKECPYGGRIQQMPEVLSRAQALRGDNDLTPAQDAALAYLYRTTQRVAQILEAVDVRTGAASGNLAIAAQQVASINSRVNYSTYPSGTGMKVACQGDVDTILNKLG